MDPMRKVIIESPYAGNVEANLQYARGCLRDSLGRGEAPLASHLLYTQEGVLDDTSPEERKWGMSAGFNWTIEADAVIAYIDMGISSGMVAGVAVGISLGKTIEMRSLKARFTQDVKIEGETLEHILNAYRRLLLSSVAP